jgi:large subunit ribosomal protein L15
VHLHELRAPDGARQKRQRVGRGTGSTRGKTSGRGQKGQLARSQGFRLGFEGGQMPLAQRLPKLGGFKNPFKVIYRPVNLGKLNRFSDGTEVTPELLAEAGLIDAGERYKVLGAGKLGRKLSIRAHAVSEGARSAIEKAGGTVSVIGNEALASAESEGAVDRTGPAVQGNVETSSRKEESPAAEE